MKISENNSKHLLSGENKVLRRISDGWIAGSEIYLGYTYRIGENKLENPLLELPEHYEEIDDPNLKETIIINEEDPLVAISLEAEPPDVYKTIPEQPQKVTLSDYRALEEKVKKIMELLGL